MPVGTLIRLADAGWEVHIATATAGDCGTMTETPWDISAIRTKEARTLRWDHVDLDGDPDARMPVPLSIAV